MRNGFNFYHQYAQLDFTLLDRRLGTLEELRKLVADAHALGIYVIIDVVLTSCRAAVLLGVCILVGCLLFRSVACSVASLVN